MAPHRLSSLPSTKDITEPMLLFRMYAPKSLSAEEPAFLVDDVGEMKARLNGIRVALVARKFAEMKVLLFEMCVIL